MPVVNLRCKRSERETSAEGKMAQCERSESDKDDNVTPHEGTDNNTQTTVLSEA